LLFLLAAGFSLIFGLMRIANLTHGALYMLGAYFGVSILKVVPNLWLAALLGGLGVALLGGLFERFILRKLQGNVLGQVEQLATDQDGKPSALSIRAAKDGSTVVVSAAAVSYDGHTLVTSSDQPQIAALQPQRTAAAQ